MKTLFCLVFFLSITTTVRGAALKLGIACTATTDTCTTNAGTCTAVGVICACSTNYIKEGLDTCVKQAGVACALGTDTCVINADCTNSVCTCYDGYTTSGGRCKPTSGASHVMYSLTALLVSALLSMRYCLQ